MRSGGGEVGDVPVAILAGGRATRLGAIAADLPKALVPVAGRPFIEHQFAWFRREGVKRVVLCVGHLGEQVRAHVGNGAAFGLDVAYSFDGPRALGTGGALRQALPLLADTFFVLYGDSYLDLGLAGVLGAFAASGRPALMTVFRNEGRWDTSNVVFDGAQVVRYSKQARVPEMHYIDYGLGVLDAGVLVGRRDEAFDLADVYAALAAAGELAGFEARRRFYEIGTPAGLAEADAYLRQIG